MAFLFDGVDQYLTLASIPFAGVPFAFSTWVNHHASESKHIFSATAPGGDSIRCRTTVSSDILRFTLFDGVSNFHSVTTTGRPLDEWFHILCVAHSTTSRSVWLNGGSLGVNISPAVLDTQTECTLATNVGVSDFLDGSLAEAAFWAGSGVENFDAAEAGILAAGYCPLCLTSYLPNLSFYQPLVRDANWNSNGPSVTVGGAPTASEHPRIIYPSDDNSIRAAGSGSAGRVQSQAILPLGLNFER